MSFEKLTASSDLLVSFARLLGKTLLLLNRVHWFAKKVLKSIAKKVLKSSAFSLKFVINLLTEKWYGKTRVTSYELKAWKHESKA